MKSRIPVLICAALCLCSLDFGQDREVSWKSLLPNFVEDQESIWSFPARLDQPHDYVPTIAVGAIATGLFLGADPPVARYFRNSTNYGDFNNVFSSFNTSIGPLLVPAGLYLIGAVEKDKKMRDTALFSAEAVIGAEWSRVR